MEDKLDKTEMEMIDSKKQASTYMERVLNTNDDVRNKFEHKFSSELEELKSKVTDEPKEKDDV